MQPSISELRQTPNCDVRETVKAELTHALVGALAAHWNVNEKHPELAKTRLKQAVIAAHSHGVLSETETQDLIRKFELGAS